MLRTIALLPLACCAALMCAQTTSKLGGAVNDAVTQHGIPDVRVDLVLKDTTISALTDAEGRFRFSAIPTGIFLLRAQRMGYETQVLPEVWVRSGKEEQVEMALRVLAHELPAAEVVAETPQTLTAIGTHVITVEQSLRYPASFFDPARLANTRPGVAATDDQANHFSVRGNGPASNAYLLEGAEIVNPNHLTNAGTASDEPTLSGGGVSILSAQMLGTSRLLTGGFDAVYGNALGGIMDLHLRRGTSERQAFTAQAGLLGIDLSTEGPYKKGGGASYLVNYRYSTIGLLSAMGVELGDEVITFQDLSFHTALPIARGSLSLFGMGGLSSNKHDALEDTTDWEFDKDSQDIEYTASMGAVGGTLRLLMGTKAVWQTTAVISANAQSREEKGVVGAEALRFNTTSSLYERKVSVVSQVHGSCSTRFDYQLGASAMQRTVEKTIGFREEVIGWLLRPYGQGNYAITDRLRAELGVAYAHYTFNNTSVVEPRAKLDLRVGKDRSLSLAAGQRSQLPPTQVFRVDPIESGWNNAWIGPMRSQEIVLGYDHPFKPHLILHAEVFYQQLRDIPVADTSQASFPPATGVSVVNVWDRGYYYGLTQNGKATNQGVELSFQHTFHNSFFYQVNATWLDATYTDVYDNTYDARWNTNMLANLMVGREFAKQKDRVKRTWGVNGRLYMMGGQRFTPILRTTTDGSEPYSAELNTFYRVDLRIYLKREHAHRTGMWALDLQNATNAQNEAYQYFDQRKGEVVTKYQLGLIPNLSYRIEF